MKLTRTPEFRRSILKFARIMEAESGLIPIHQRNARRKYLGTDFITGADIKSLANYAAHLLSKYN